ncbi:class I adenylate-forming enzyme family protein [Campylobacter vicugnae]|uniref:class I adenylate-forming enzyme family protein n=1 Tax=Campylobacter vicugnae TaxID=1660076 RepID=UPI00254A78B0|nr:class I adenylate-forming enzyme family protein [Campylobacter ovis]MDL0095182.1 acyl--CoA ligase [Campylobacter ovis]
MSVLYHLLINAKNHPNAPAIIADDGEVSYFELFAYTLEFAKNLKSKNAKIGDKIVIKCYQNIAFCVAFLGTQLAGCTAVPVEPDVTDSRLDIIKSELVDFKLFDQYNLSEFAMAKSDDVAKFDLNDLPSADNVSEILYTTGTTGRQKGIMHSFTTQFCAVENLLSIIDTPPNTKTLITCPMNHAFSIRRFYASIVTVSCTALCKGVVPLQKFHELLKEWEINAAVFAPSALGIILNESKFDIKSSFERLNYIEFAGSYLQSNLVTNTLQIASHLKIYNVFGSSEFGCATGIDEAINNQKGCIGRPTIHTKVYIIDDNGNELEDGKYGYLALSGGSFMLGYISGENILNKNGIYVTQDICYKKNGLIYFIGRDSDVINIGGLKVSPDDVEDIANTYPLIMKSACVGKMHKLAGQVPVLFVVPKNGFSADEFYKFLKTHLQTHEFPKEIHQIDEIPHTYNGKIDRKKLRNILNE